MYRYIIIALFIALIAYLFRAFFSSLKETFTGQHKQTTRSSRGIIDRGKMLKCDQCETYFQEESAVVIRERHNTYNFCSTECRDLFKRKN